MLLYRNGRYAISCCFLHCIAGSIGKHGSCMGQRFRFSLLEWGTVDARATEIILEKRNTSGRSIWGS